MLYVAVHLLAASMSVEFLSCVKNHQVDYVEICSSVRWSGSRHRKSRLRSFEKSTRSCNPSSASSMYALHCTFNACVSIFNLV